MKKYCLQVLLLISLLSFYACSSPCGSNKDQFMENFNAFMEDMKAQELEKGSSKWQSYDNKLRTFIKECYPTHKAKLSLSQQKDFWIGTVGYFYARYGVGMLSRLGNMGDDLDELWTEVKTNLAELNIGVKDAIKTISDKWGVLQDIGKDLKKLFE
ncbi:MAG: hypothetical protein GY810_12750 [Aureispira sp.]|nr:hypothetical protein [Aureispira sp.]